MLAHARRRGGRIALEDRLGDGAVFPDRRLEHGRRQHVADLRHDQRQLQPHRQLAQLKIVCERHHGVVEGGVFLEIIARVARRLGMDRLDRGGEARAPLRRVGDGRKAGGERLHFDPDQEQFADLALGQAPDHRAAMRPMLDQPVGAEAPQALPHRPAADCEAGGQVGFDEPRSRLKAPGPNVLAQALDDEGDGRAMRGRDGRTRPPSSLRRLACLSVSPDGGV